MIHEFRSHSVRHGRVCLFVILTGVCSISFTAWTDAFTPAMITATHERIARSLCVVSYTSEMTHPMTGQTARRQTRTLGVLVRDDGLLIAHGHMKMDNSEPIAVRVKVGLDASAREYDARVLPKPSDVNLCFLQIEGITARLDYLEFVDRPLTLGDPLLLVGILGDAMDHSPIIMLRRIGAIIEKPRLTYCLDEPIGFGFLTAPALDPQGRVVGLIGTDMSPEEGGDIYVRSGHPLLYQTDLFAKYIAHPPTLDRRDQERDSYIGVLAQPLTDDLALYWGLEPEGGVVLSTLLPGAPADLAGLQRGDIIISFNHVPMRMKEDHQISTFTKIIRDTPAGQPVPVEVLRKGEPLTVELTPIERPKSIRDADEFEDEVFGLTVREITQDIRLRMNLSEEVQGVIVRTVRSGSWAQQAGFAPGFIIMNMGGHLVTGLDDYETAINQIIEEKPSQVAVFCRVGPRTGFLRISPSW